MSISAPPGRPSISETLSTSFRDGFSVTKKNAVPALLLIAIAFICACALFFTGAVSQVAVAAAGTANSTMQPAAIAAICVMDLLFAVVSMYALAAAVRTIHADFGFTVGRFFGMLGYSLLTSLLVMLAFVCFVIPGYWVAPKIMLAPYVYLLDGPAPIKTSWNMTTGYYWQTVGMMLLAGLCVGVLMDAAFFACIFAVTAAPWSLIVLMPVAAAVLVWLLHVQSLVYVRWVDGLLPRANMPAMGAAPAPA